MVYYIIVLQFNNGFNNCIIVLQFRICGYIIVWSSLLVWFISLVGISMVYYIILVLIIIFRGINIDCILSGLLLVYYYVYCIIVIYVLQFNVVNRILVYYWMYIEVNECLIMDYNYCWFIMLYYWDISYYGINYSIIGFYYCIIEVLMWFII